MENLLKIAFMILSQPRPGETAAGRMTTGALCTAFAAVALFAGIACMIAALWIYLIPEVGPVSAALIVGAVLLFLSGILFLVARSIFTPDQSAPPQPAIGEELMELLRDGIEDNKGAALMAALVAGLMAGGLGRR